MLILMTINTQQLPVTAIRWIVIMIMVFMVHGEFFEIFAVELAAAMTANPRKQVSGHAPDMSFHALSGCGSFLIL